jgi:hypothetical protein
MAVSIAGSMLLYMYPMFFLFPFADYVPSIPNTIRRMLPRRGNRYRRA